MTRCQCLALGLFASLAASLGCSESKKNAGPRPPSPPMEHDANGAAPHDAASTGDSGLAASPASPIWIENMLPGVAHDAPDMPAIDEVAGYSSAVSAAPGATIQLFANVDHDQNVRWDLYRMGYYGGLGTRLVARGESRPVSVQPECPTDPITGMIECDWAPAFDVLISEEWVSGYYFFELINEDGFGARVPFVVREGTRRAAGLAQASVTTWQAYNRWGGISIYANDRRDGPYKLARGHCVSFDRPYLTQNEFRPFLHLLRFIERRGYDVSYTTNIDVDEDPSTLAGRKLFMTLSHDEYWSLGQRDALDAARDSGVSLGFFSGNTAYWRIRYEPNARGVLRRRMTCHKSASTDPVKNAPDTTVLYADQPHARPENSLLGVLYKTWSKVPGFPCIVTNAGHWVYEGTGVKDRDALSNVVGSEWDGVSDNGLTPAGLEVLTSAITLNNDGVFVGGLANATVYYPTPASIVFAAGTIDWGLGVGDGPVADARVERMTENVLARAGLVSRIPVTVPAPRTSNLPAVESRILAGSGEAGQVNDAATKASFGGPSGIAGGPDGKLYIVDRGTQALRVLSRDGMVSSFVSGPDAQLSRPNGVTIDRQGALYVSDPDNHTIVRIASDGSFAPYAGSGTAGANDASDPLLATFSGPRGLAFGPDGALYVADNQNDAIRRIDGKGVTTVATGLRFVSGVAVGADGAVYFSTIAYGQIGVVRDGEVTMLANLSGDPGNTEGPAAKARLQPGEGMLVEDDRLVFVDTENNRVRALSLKGTPTISTIFGDGNPGVDASDTEHTYLPRGITHFDGGYALTDFGNRRILWFKEATTH